MASYADSVEIYVGRRAHDVSSGVGRGSVDIDVNTGLSHRFGLIPHLSKQTIYETKLQMMKKSYARGWEAGDRRSTLLEQKYISAEEQTMSVQESMEHHVGDEILRFINKFVHQTSFIKKDILHSPVSSDSDTSVSGLAAPWSRGTDEMQNASRNR